MKRIRKKKSALLGDPKFESIKLNAGKAYLEEKTIALEDELPVITEGPGIKGDGTQNSPLEIELASEDYPGIVRPDGKTIKVVKVIPPKWMGDDEVTLIKAAPATDDSLGTVLSGNFVSITDGRISVDVAEGNLKGVMAPDGVSTVVSEGTLSVVTAKASNQNADGRAGIVQPDGTSITCAADGLISVDPQAFIDNSTIEKNTLGKLKVKAANIADGTTIQSQEWIGDGNQLSVNTIGIVDNDTLKPDATSGKLHVNLEHLVDNSTIYVNTDDKLAVNENWVEFNLGSPAGAIGSTITYHVMLAVEDFQGTLKGLWKSTMLYNWVDISMSVNMGRLAVVFFTICDDASKNRGHAIQQYGTSSYRLHPFSDSNCYIRIKKSDVDKLKIALYTTTTELTAKSVYWMPNTLPATTTDLGLVKPDGSSIQIDSYGTISTVTQAIPVDDNTIKVTDGKLTVQAAGIADGSGIKQYDFMGNKLSVDTAAIADGQSIVTDVDTGQLLVKLDPAQFKPIGSGGSSDPGISLDPAKVAGWIPWASTDRYGLSKLDGTTIKDMSMGTIGVPIDHTTIKISDSGLLEAVGAAGWTVFNCNIGSGGATHDITVRGYWNIKGYTVPASLYVQMFFIRDQGFGADPIIRFIEIRDKSICCNNPDVLAGGYRYEQVDSSLSKFSPVGGGSGSQDIKILIKTVDLERAGGNLFEFVNEAYTFPAESYKEYTAQGGDIPPDESTIYIVAGQLKARALQNGNDGIFNNSNGWTATGGLKVEGDISCDSIDSPSIPVPDDKTITKNDEGKLSVLIDDNTIKDTGGELAVNKQAMEAKLVPFEMSAKDLVDQYTDATIIREMWWDEVVDISAIMGGTNMNFEWYPNILLPDGTIMNASAFGFAINYNKNERIVYLTFYAIDRDPFRFHIDDQDVDFEEDCHYTPNMINLDCFIAVKRIDDTIQIKMHLTLYDGGSKLWGTYSMLIKDYMPIDFNVQCKGVLKEEDGLIWPSDIITRPEMKEAIQTNGLFQNEARTTFITKELFSVLAEQFSLSTDKGKATGLILNEKGSKSSLSQSGPGGILAIRLESAEDKEVGNKNIIRFEGAQYLAAKGLANVNIASDDDAMAIPNAIMIRDYVTNQLAFQKNDNGGVELIPNTLTLEQVMEKTDGGIDYRCQYAQAVNLFSFRMSQAFDEQPYMANYFDEVRVQPGGGWSKRTELSACDSGQKRTGSVLCELQTNRRGNDNYILFSVSNVDQASLASQKTVVTIAPERMIITSQYAPNWNNPQGDEEKQAVTVADVKTYVDNKLEEFYDKTTLIDNGANDPEDKEEKQTLLKMIKEMQTEINELKKQIKCLSK